MNDIEQDMMMFIDAVSQRGKTVCDLAEVANTLDVSTEEYELVLKYLKFAVDATVKSYHDAVKQEVYNGFPKEVH